MTSSRVRRATVGTLDGSFGSPLRNRRIVVSFEPGDGDKIKDFLVLRPMRTRQSERISVIDAYRFAMRCRVNLAVLEKARTTKAAKALKRESRRIKAYERKLFSNGEV